MRRPAVHEGRVYVIDNSANVHCLDAETGKQYWEQNIGTVGKGSPTWGRWQTLCHRSQWRRANSQSGRCGCNSPRQKENRHARRRHAEIYGSVAIAYRRIYFATEAGLFLLGDKPRRLNPRPRLSQRPNPRPAGAKPASILSIPRRSHFAIRRSPAPAGRRLRRQGPRPWRP